MHYGELVTLFEDHVVTAAEAAYGTLVCLFLPGRGRQWRESLPIDSMSHRDEEWHIETMDAVILDSSRTLYEGRPGAFFSCLPIGEAAEFQGLLWLPANPVQYMGSPICLERPVDVKHGAGFYLFSPAYLQDDIIRINLTYRVVTHD